MRMFSRSDLTVPNIMTCMRILMAILAGALFLQTREETIAAVICIVASILDYFDGLYARRLHQSTRLGMHLDPFADKVLISVVFVTLSVMLRWTWFSLFVGIILFRELLITIYRMVRRRRVGEFVPASKLGKLKTAVQCVVGDSILFYIYIYPARVPTHTLLIFILMTLTLFLTIDSGLCYLLPSCPDGKKRSVLERLGQLIFGIRAREV